MLTNILTVLVIGYVLFELIEHVLFPLVWSFVTRNRRSLCGNEGMIGKTVEVLSWQSGEGRVLVDGELWNAASSDQLRSGDKALVQKVDGLVLKIASCQPKSDRSVLCNPDKPSVLKDKEGMRQHAQSHVMRIAITDYAISLSRGRTV